MAAPEITIFAEFDDPDFAADVRATLEREHRSMKAVVQLALNNYIAASKAEARAAKVAAKQAPQVAA